MPNTAELIFKEIDNSQQVGAISQNISGVLYDAEMGPINEPSEVITTSSQFVQLFGAIRPDRSNEEAFTSIMRALERGTALRVVNVKHYTDIDNEGSLEVTAAIPEAVKNFVLSAAIIEGQHIFVQAGFVTKEFVAGSNPVAVYDQIFQWLKTDWAVAFNLGGPVLYTKLIDNTHFYIVTSNRDFEVLITMDGDDAPTITSPLGPLDITNQADENMVHVHAKYPGVRYNDVVLILEPSASGPTFNATVHLINSGQPPEVYTGLTFDTFPNKVNNASKWIVAYPYNTAANVGQPILKRTMVLRFNSGSNGGAISASDVIGSSTTKTGFFAFDGYDDLARIGNFVMMNEEAIEEAGSAYAAGRKDLTYFTAIYGTSRNDVINYRNSLNINSSFTRFYSAGEGIYVKSRNGQGDIVITPLGDILGIAAQSAYEFGPWYSYANSNRGSLNNVIKVGNKWGVAGNAKDLQLLALSQINAVITQDKSTMIWGNFTSQVNESLLSYNSIRDLIIYIEKSLRPTLRPFLEEPNDIPTWIHIYNAVHPFFTGLETKRALEFWKWRGDQNAASMRELKVNKFSDVQQGKYLVMLDLQPINSLQQFTLAISLNSVDSSIAITEL